LIRGQVRIADLNRDTALGMPNTEAVGYVCPGKGEAPSNPDLGNKAVP